MSLSDMRSLRNDQWASKLKELDHLFAIGQTSSAFKLAKSLAQISKNNPVIKGFETG